MKKERCRFCIALLFIALILSSCYSVPSDIEKEAATIFVWDESIPKEQLVGLFIHSAGNDSRIKITEYNEISVNWDPGTLVYIPPGRVSILMDVRIAVGGTRITTGKNVPFEWTFNAGDRYILFGYVEDTKYLKGPPVIRIIDPNSEVKWYKQNLFYRLPQREGTINLK